MTGNIAPELTGLVGAITRDVSKDDALSFGKQLGLSEAVIQSVVQESEFTTRGPYIALALYKEAERRNTFISHSFVTSVAGSLLDVCATSGIDDDEKNKMRQSIATMKKNSLLCHSAAAQLGTGRVKLLTLHPAYQQTTIFIDLGETRGTLRRSYQKVTAIATRQQQQHVASCDCETKRNKAKKHLLCTKSRLFRSTL